MEILFRSTANSALCGHYWLQITLQSWHRSSDHSHRMPYDQRPPQFSERRHCGDPLELFAEPGPSSITEAMEHSEYENGADDSV